MLTCPMPSALVQCESVPIWDISNWLHPGGPFVQASNLCSSVRPYWISKGSHLYTGVNPETAPTLSGGGVRVPNSLYRDPSCPPEQDPPPPSPPPLAASSPSPPPPSCPPVGEVSTTCFTAGEPMSSMCSCRYAFSADCPDPVGVVLRCTSN